MYGIPQVNGATSINLSGPNAGVSGSDPFVQQQILLLCFLFVVLDAVLYNVANLNGYDRLA